MSTVREFFSPFMGGSGLRCFAKTPWSMGGRHRSSHAPIIYEVSPPSPYAFFQNATGTSPRRRGEESTALPSPYPSTPNRNLTVSALHYFLSPGQKIRDVSRA